MVVEKNATEHRKPELSIYLGVSILLLVLGFLLGMTNPSHFSAQLSPSLKQLVQSIQPMKSLPWPHTFLLLFLHNAVSATELAIFGIAFGIFPAYLMWMNGLMSGFVVGLIATQHGIPPWKTIVFGLLPHGIFELSAIVWAAALGLRNGLAIIRVIRRQFGGGRAAKLQVQTIRDGPVAFRDAHPLRFALIRTARSLPIIWGMLLVAALIESAITPHIMAWGIPGLHHETLP